MILSPPLHRRENRRSWWRRYLDPKGTQRGRHSNDKSSANNKSVDPSDDSCCPLPPPPEGTVGPFDSRGSCFARNTPAIEFFPLLVESRASRNFLAPSRLFIFLFLFSPPFLPLFLSSFPRSLSERKRGIYIYIYMVNRQQFVHRRNNISDRDQREVVEEKWRN